MAGGAWDLRDMRRASPLPAAGWEAASSTWRRRLPPGRDRLRIRHNRVLHGRGDARARASDAARGKDHAMDALSLGRRSLLLTAGARAAFAQSAAQRVGFEAMTVGAPPAGFTTGL